MRSQSCSISIASDVEFIAFMKNWWKKNAMQTLLVEFDMICKQKMTRALRLNDYNTEDDNNNKNWLIDID